MTPPRKLVTTAAPADALDALCADLVERGIPVPGVLGPAPAADAFAATWNHRTGDTVHPERELRIYQLASVVPPRRVSGALRPATAPDLTIVEAWAHAFVADTGLRDAADDVPDDVRRAVRDGRLYVWDDGRPVTMAAWAGATPNGVRVTLVYTPPALRGRGYASSCVASLSALLLASGRRVCFLFTDLANPTSNSIYAKIGYQPVCDVHDYRFERRLEGRRG
jgi:predicted GNAT family acetyltransferase